jgi:hypothetical protein
MSMTGTNADFRFPMRASQEALYVATLYNYIAIATGAKQIPVPQQGELAGNSIKKTADALVKAKGSSLVISASNEVEVQKIVNGINMLLGNYGSTIDMVNHSNQYKGSDKKMAEVLAGLKSGFIAGVIFYNANPVYNHNSKEWSEALKKAITDIQALRAEFWSSVLVPGTADEFNTELEKAGRVADFLELGELMCKDALERNESCGGHFREEYQTEEGEALRDDENFSFVTAWELTGDNQWNLHKEELKYENIKIAARSYK